MTTPAEDPRVEPNDLPTKPSQPEARQTARLDKGEIMQAQLTQVLARLGEGFSKVDTLVLDVTRLTGTVELVSNDLGIVKDRVTILESERSKYSGPVRALSVSDAGQNMQIASLAVKVDEALAATAAVKVDVKAVATTADASHAMLTTVTSILDKPIAKKVGYAAGVFALAALTAGTGYLARGNVQAPQPTIIQVAPVAAVDGGAR